jgi:hypothetical protein
MGMRKVFYPQGMERFGEAMVKNHGYQRYVPSLHSYEDTFFNGLYFDIDYKIFAKHCGKAIVFWNGSDAIRLAERPHKEWKKAIFSREAVHLCHSEITKLTLHYIGIEATVHPLFFGKIEDFDVSYKWKPVPNVYLNAHPEREKEYGLPMLVSLAKELPCIIFHVYGGARSEDLHNILYHGRVPESQMDREIANFQGTLRLLKPEFPEWVTPASSQTMVKSALMAQYAISIVNIPGSWWGRTEEALKTLLQKLPEARQPNLKFRSIFLDRYKDCWNLWDRYLN